MPSPHPPTPLRQALRLMVLCVAIELLGFVFSGHYSTGSIVGIFAGTACVYGLLRLVLRGNNWARWGLAAVVGLGVISSLVGFVGAYQLHPGATVIDLIATIISLVALALLFGQETNAWFRAHRRTRTR